jgi:hypothetical protein
MDQTTTLAKAILHTIKFLQKGAGVRDGFDEHVKALKEILESGEDRKGEK